MTTKNEIQRVEIIIGPGAKSLVYKITDVRNPINELVLCTVSTVA